MGLNEQIAADYIKAYKAGDQVRVNVLRLLKTAVKNRLVDLRRPGGTLDDAEYMDVIIRQAKQREDSIIQYQDANRPDLAEKEKAELLILQSYLPEKISPEKLDEIIAETIKNVNAASLKDMGKVMNAIMAQYKGAVDGKLLSEKVRQKLA